MRNGVKQYIELIVGVCLMSIAYKSIYEQAGMVTGGFSGIGVIVKELTSGLFEDGIPLWVTNIMLNISAIWFNNKWKHSKNGINYACFLYNSFNSIYKF